MNRPTPAPEIDDWAAETALSNCLPETTTRITRIELPVADALRVNVQGICVGRPVDVLHLGDPLMLGVAGTIVGISARLADRIYAVPTSPRRQ